MTTKSRLTAVLAMAAVAGIGLATPSLAQSTATAGSASAPYCGIYWGSLPKVQTGSLGLGPVKDLRAGQHDCFDRLVIDVHGPVGGYNVHYVEGTPAAGNPNGLYARGGANLDIWVNNVVVAVPGTHHSTAVDNPDEAVDVSGYRTFRQVRELIYGPLGNYGPEGVEFALGVRAHLPFRVFTLAGSGLDSRLVIDVAHQW
jgi:hypothetical protein